MAFPTWLPGAVNFLRWVRGLFVMSKASFGPPDNGASETGLNHIHIPVSVKANFFGSEPILGAEPWAQLSDGTSTHTIKLLWRNENDSNAPFPNIDLRAGRTYYIPIVARSTRSGLSLSGRVVTVIPMELYSAWVLSAGVRGSTLCDWRLGHRTEKSPSSKIIAFMCQRKRSPMNAFA